MESECALQTPRIEHQLTHRVSEKQLFIADGNTATPYFIAKQLTAHPLGDFPEQRSDTAEADPLYS